MLTLSASLYYPTEKNAYWMTPSLNTRRELASAQVAPMKADEPVNGVTTTFSGTPFNASLPLTLRVPSLRRSFAFTNMECLHLRLWPMRLHPFERSLWCGPRNVENGEVSGAIVVGGKNILVWNKWVVEVAAMAKVGAGLVVPSPTVQG